MKTLQVRLLAQCAILLGALLSIGNVTPANAQMPGPHPPYLHALQNLREARNLLQTNFGDPAHAQAAAAALPEINSAIGDLKTASKLDDKNLGDVPPATNGPAEGRFRRVAQLLALAHHDTKGPEADPIALPAKERAQKHIDAASAIIAGVH